MSPGDAAVRRVRIELEHSTTVAVDGTVVADPEPTLPAPSLPAVTMRMPGFVAHTLAHVLAEWTRACELVGAGTRVDWWRQAQALHDAAHATGSGLATGLGAHPDR